MAALPRPPAAIVFDLDGTLIDSAPDLHAAALGMLAALGRPALTLAEVTAFIGNGVPTLVARCLAATGGLPDAAAEAAALADFRARYDADPTRLTRPYPGAAALLAELAAAGLGLGVCTNKPRAAALAILERLGLLAHLAAVVGGDEGPMKPDPAPLLLTVARLGADPGATLYVGDSEVDAETAVRAALPFALHTAGYRRTPVAGIPHALRFDSFAELAALLRAVPAA